MVVNRGMGGPARDAGFTDVREVEVWQQVQLGPLRITAAPAKHGVPEVTFVLQGTDRTVFLAPTPCAFLNWMRSLRAFP